MLTTPSRLVVLDCVNVNHSPAVVEAFTAAGIEVYPSAGAPHNVEAGYPPYSHDCSILDGALFRPFQIEIAEKYMAQGEAAGRTSMCVFMDSIAPLWMSDKYRRLAREAVAKQADVLVRISELGGARK